MGTYHWCPARTGGGRPARYSAAAASAWRRLPAMNIARIDLVTLSLFVSVARQGSISAGARASHLAVGAASKRISDLEAALDTQLLYRNAAGVELTEAGQACLVHALRVLQEVEQMAGTLSDYARGVRGQVRIAANTSSLTQFLPEDLASFMEAHPAVRIDLEEQNSSDIVTAVLENRADIGVFADRTPAAGLATVPYRLDELVLIVRSAIRWRARPAWRSPTPWPTTMSACRPRPRWPPAWPTRAAGWGATCGCVSRCAASTPSAAWWPPRAGSASCRAWRPNRMRAPCPFA